MSSFLTVVGLSIPLLKLYNFMAVMSDESSMSLLSNIYSELSYCMN